VAGARQYRPRRLRAVAWQKHSLAPHDLPHRHRGEIKGKTHITDVAVTALAHLGVPLDEKWQLDGKPQSRLKK
jgi:hypothetical protein